MILNRQNKAKAPFNPLKDLDETRFKRAADQKKVKREKIAELYHKSYNKLEQIPEDWTIKTSIDISFPAGKLDHLQIQKIV